MRVILIRPDALVPMLVSVFVNDRLFGFGSWDWRPGRGGFLHDAAGWNCLDWTRGFRVPGRR